MSSLQCCWCVCVWVCVYIHTYVFVCEQEEGQNEEGVGGTQEVNDIPDLNEGWKRRCVCVVGLQCLEVL